MRQKGDLETGWENPVGMHPEAFPPCSSVRFPQACLAWQWCPSLGFTAGCLAAVWPGAPVPSLSQHLGGSGFWGTCDDCLHPVPSCRCTRTTCTLQTADFTPLRRCFTRWGPSTPATWNSPPSTPPPRATWASMWAPTSLPLPLGLLGPCASPLCPTSVCWTETAALIHRLC